MNLLIGGLLVGATAIGVCLQVSVFRDFLRSVKERAYWDGWTDCAVGRFPKEEVK